MPLKFILPVRGENTSVACAKKVPLSNLNKRHSNHYEVISQEAFSGITLGSGAMGPREIHTFKNKNDGQHQFTVRYFSTAGKLVKERTEIVNGVLHELYERYYLNNQLPTKRTYEYGRKMSSENYHRNGELSNRFDILQGIDVFYDEEGRRLE